METPFLEFAKRRDFSNKLSDTFAFVRSNFKSLFRSMLYIAGPPVLITSLLISSFFKDIFSLSLGVAQNPTGISDYFTSVSFWAEVGLAMVFGFVTVVLVTSVTYNFIILYRERRSGSIEVTEVWERVQSTFWSYLWTTIAYVLVALVGYIVLLLPMALLTVISPLLMFFGVMIFLCVLVYFLIAFSLIFVVRAFEPIGIFAALRRSFHLIRDKWWSTFGTIFILSMVVNVVSYIFFIPAYGMMMWGSLHSLDAGNAGELNNGPMIMTFMTLYYLCQLVLSCLPNIGLCLQYFNLVELKEARGLMDQLQGFGQPHNPTEPREETSG